MSTPTLEAVKEVGRLALFTAIAAAVTAVIDYLTALNSTEIWVVALTAVLRFADKYIHKSSDIKSNGIAPF